MSVAWYFILWLATIFIIAQIRLGYVLYKRPRRFTTIAPTGTAGLIYGSILNSIKPLPVQGVNWKRDGF
jgi:hypothetical protein